MARSPAVRPFLARSGTRPRRGQRTDRQAGHHQSRREGGEGRRRFAFAAIVVVGDQRGRVGHGAGKAREVPEAIRKATEAAKRSLIRVPLRDGARYITTSRAASAPAR